MPTRILGAVVAALLIVMCIGMWVHQTPPATLRLEPVAGPPTTAPTTAPTTTTVVSDAPVAPPDPMDVARLYGACLDDTRSDPASVAVGRGAGRAVGVIGDSLSTQIRGQLLEDSRHRWVIWSRCGATTQTALDAGAVASVRAEHPDVVVVALGTNDAGFPTPSPGSSAGFTARAQRVLTALSGVPCVVWVNVAQHGDPMLQAEMDTINATVRAGGVRVIDWDRIVESEPGLLLDRVHLAPAGQDRRTQAVVAAVDGC